MGSQFLYPVISTLTLISDKSVERIFDVQFSKGFVIVSRDKIISLLRPGDENQRQE